MTGKKKQKKGKKGKATSKGNGGDKMFANSGDFRVNRNLYHATGIYRFTRRAGNGSISQTASGDTLTALGPFSLSAVHGYTELTNLFDQYRIEAVEITFKPMYNMQAINTASALITPTLYTVIDVNDVASPGTLGALLEYQSLIETNFDESVTRTVQPKAALALYTGAFNGYGSGSPWVDTNSPGVQYYALKAGVNQAAVGQTALQTWNVYYKFYIACKFVV